MGVFVINFSTRNQKVDTNLVGNLDKGIEVIPIDGTEELIY